MPIMPNTVLQKYDVEMMIYNRNNFRDFSATCRDLDVERGCLKLTGYLAAFKVTLDWFNTIYYELIYH